MSEKNQKCDIVIIGAGPAGLTAAIYSAWLGLKTVVLEAGVTGGRAGLAPKIENFPGFPDGISGNELADRMRMQAERFNAEFRSDEEMIGLDLESEAKKVISRKQTYQAPAIIIATGTQGRKLSVQGETEFLGRGVSYCAVCDGPFFRNKAVAVIGNGEDAAADALSLADVASKITIVTQGKDLTIDKTLLAKLQNKPKIEIVKGQVTKIVGEQMVNTIHFQSPGVQGEVELAVRGVFVAMGNVPMTAVVRRAGIHTDYGWLPNS